MALFGQAAGSMFGGGRAQGSAMMQPNQQWMQQPQGGIGPSPEFGTQLPQQSQQQQPYKVPKREEWRDQWMGAGKMTPQQADQWLQSHGATQMQGGGKAGRWITPHGERLDLQIARGAAMAGKRGGMITPGWTRMGKGGGQQQDQGMGQGGGMEQMMGGNTGYSGGLGPSMGGGPQMMGMPWTHPGQYGQGGGMGSTPGHWGNPQTSLPWGQMGGGPMSRTQQMMGQQPQAQMMPTRQATTPYQSQYPRRMGGY